MPWNEPGGDGGKNQQDPWTGKNKSSGKNDAEEIVNKLNEKLGGLFGGGKSGGDGDGSPISYKGIGLLGMQERLESLGGQLTIDSRPGQGTRLVAGIPRQELG